MTQHEEKKGGERGEKQTLSLQATESSKGQAETCQLVAACWPTGRWVPPQGASRPLHWLCLNKPGRSCAQHSRRPQL